MERRKKIVVLILFGIIGLLLLLQINWKLKQEETIKDNVPSDTSYQQYQDDDKIAENEKLDNNSSYYQYSDGKSYNQYTGFSNVMIEGYVSFEKQYDEAHEWCYESEESCQDIPYDNYVYFHVISSNDKKFDAFLEELNGDDSDNMIGLGCLVDNQIKYANASDEFKLQNNRLNNDVGEFFKDFSLTSEDTNKIIEATKENPVKLKIDKLPFTSGFGGFSCVSLITYIRVVN